MRARGPQTADATALEIGSAAAKRAYFAAQLAPKAPPSAWERQHLLADRRAPKRGCPEIVRIRCGNRIHRLRLFADGGPAVLLDHPHLDRKAELALVALGALRPDCLLVFDAIAGRVSTRRILWRRRAYRIATDGAHRHCRRRPGPTPALEQSLAARYADFVRHRATLWLDHLLPAGTNFEVLVVPPPALRARLPVGPSWSWRRSPGFTFSRSRWLQVHIAFDWHVSVEQAHGARLPEGFILEARADRRGRLIYQILWEAKLRPYWSGIEGTERIERVGFAGAVPRHQWYRARRSCEVRLAAEETSGRLA
jgi:hypothetical protein